MNYVSRHPITNVYVYENGILIKTYRGRFRFDEPPSGSLILHDDENHIRYVIRPKGTVLTETYFNDKS